MYFYSTNKQAKPVQSKEAILAGMASDGGLFMPQTLPPLSSSVIAALPDLTLHEIAYEISCRLFDDVPASVLMDTIAGAFTFPVPIVALNGKQAILELFHGPTLAFKDFAARYMSRLMSYLARASEREMLVVVATSGDTGSAVADGFLNIPGIRVVVLYPAGKVSQIQEQHLTTRGGNITAVQIAGTFDDCQTLAKHALQDQELQKKYQLVSANSINVARLIPQACYYAYAYGQMACAGKPVVISVPSGNFGNLTAGVIAQRLGVPIAHFIAATNSNDVVPEYLKTGVFNPRPSQRTLANAMDVGNPSNFARLRELFNNDALRMAQHISGFAYHDDQVRAHMRTIYEHYGYIAEPHTTIAHAGLDEYQHTCSTPTQGIALATAHPAKFSDIVKEVLSISLPLPTVLQDCLQREKSVVACSNEYAALQHILHNPAC